MNLEYMMQKSKLEQKERERQYRSIFEAANDGLVVIDFKDGFVVETNPAICRMHGYTREEFVGLPLTGFIHTDSLPLFSEYIWVFQSEGELDKRIIHMRKDGSTFYAEWRVATFTYLVHVGKFKFEP